MNDNLEFYIIASGYNCAPLVQKCYDSILKQTYSNFAAILISDGSTDQTGDILNSLPEDPRIQVLIQSNNRGACYHRYYSIHNLYDPEIVILFLGLDDELQPNALERIKQEYDKGCLMTYGNWANEIGKGNSMVLDFPNEVHENRSYRQAKYRTTAPNTFKKKLFDRMRLEDFQHEGKFFDVCTEGPFMYAFLEMCGKDRIGIIRDYIYMYNQGLPNGTLRRLGKDYKYSVLKVIIDRPKQLLVP